MSYFIRVDHQTLIKAFSLTLRITISLSTKLNSWSEYRKVMTIHKEIRYFKLQDAKKQVVNTI